MTDLPPDTGGDTDDTGVGPTRRADLSTPPSTPRWVMVFGVIVLVLVLLFVTLHFAGLSPMGHGP